MEGVTAMQRKETTMPTLRKMQPDEVAELQREPTNGKRREIELQYDAYISDFLPFEWGKADLEDGDIKANVRNRIKAAASRRGLGVNFRRTREQCIIFQLVAHDDETVEEVTEDVPF